jgi:glutamate 5-kinase
MATRFGAYTVIAAGRITDVIKRIADGERIGTRFEPTTDRIEGWKRFLLTGKASSRGSVAIDEGATRAVRYGGNSLLPAGVVRVDGNFERGDNISILDPAGDIVAWGIANYRSVEIERLMGVRSDRIESILGYGYGPDIVHRNNMALAENDSVSPESLGETAPTEGATER